MKKCTYLVGDFETTVYKNQDHTEVWASACVELFTEDVHIFHSIDETWEYYLSLNTNLTIYYHNLKFDGEFWLYYFIYVKGYKQAYDELSPDPHWSVKFLDVSDMKSKTFKYGISDMGQWYSITVKMGNNVIEFRDSLKLLPFSVKRIGKAFKTKHQKLDMEYEGFRYAGCNITDEEKEYIANDILVVKEALETMFTEGHNKLTIGACCLSEYKKIMGKDDYKMFFPDLYEVDTPDWLKEKYPTVGDYIRKSYKGGWCYIVKGKENKKFYNGTTADVNSLYPSMMHSESGNRYPVGTPKFWKGNFIPVEAVGQNKYYFVHIRTRFYIRKNMLPFIQIKGTLMYKGTQALETSDYYDTKLGKYSRWYKDKYGNVHDTKVELVLTMTDWILMQEHYELVDCEILDGCYFYSEIGLFDEYINHYKKIKQTSTGAIRELAKLFLNNLYGKMAASTDSSFKVAFTRDNGAIGFATMEEHDKQAGYIAVGSAITSYARNFTIRAAQKNYYGVDKRGFIYADTDSIHCDLAPEEIKGIKVHDTDFCCWKLESCWDVGWFVRQKTYIEHVVKENLKDVEKPYYNIKCAGMPERSKKLFEMSMTGRKPTKEDKLNEEELEFVSKKRELEDFTVGLRVPSKLLPVHIRGGVLLVPTTYEMR